MKVLSVVLTVALLIGANYLALRLKKAGALPVSPASAQPSQTHPASSQHAEAAQSVPASNALIRL